MIEQPVPEIEQLDGSSLDISARKRDELLKLFPEARTEGGKIAFDRLELALGEHVDVGKERYGLTWPRKASCFKTIQAPSMATLLPVKDKSVKFDSTENLIIEGDNLEVLKLMQKAYLGKIKMIYIDPPYNTGNDFIYPDNYNESLQTYLEYTGQADSEGRKFGTNIDTDGRFHSKWLNMMYPRLYLARNLLRDDGVLLVSIDDGEAYNLRAILNEIFGEDCFVTQFVWNNEGNIDQQSKIKGVHEYVLCFSKIPDGISRPTVIDLNIEESSKLYNERIENSITKNGPANPPSVVILPVGFPAVFDDGTIATRDQEWPHILDPIRVKSRSLVDTARVYSGWSSRNLLDLFIRNGCVPINDSEGKETTFALTATGAIYMYKMRSAQQGHVLSVIRNVGTTKQNSNALASWGLKFPYPKPLLLLQYLADVFTKNDPDALLLDFFAGSGTLGHAVLEQNKNDGGKRRFILVQLPEPTQDSTYPTISDLTEARVRHAIATIDKREEGTLGTEQACQERGFRVFRLAQSNVKEWDARAVRGTESVDVDVLKEQLSLHIDHLRHDRSDLDVIFEILLKEGFALSSSLANETIAGRTVYSIADGAFLICLDRRLDFDLLKAIAKRMPARVLLLDEGFARNDQLKANADQTFKSKNIVLKTL